MRLIDWLRIENAVQTYDFWLELRGTRWRRRKELRGELRSNLRDAAADIGITAALFNIGSPKQLAYAVTPEASRRPRWSLGALWAVLAGGLIMHSLIFTSAAFLGGVKASGVTGREVRGGAFPWFGVDFIAKVEPDDRGLAFGASGGLWYLLVPLAVFVLVAQPWRALNRDGS